MTDQDAPQPDPPDPDSSMPADGPPAALMHQWVLAGIVSAAARFIPIPFVDDIVRDRSRRFVVSRTLAAHGRTYRSRQLSVLYGDNTGCLMGCVMFGVMFPIKLLMFPIRKLVTIFTSVRGVPMDLLKTILIGRTLDRCLRKGMLMDGDGPADLNARTAEAQQVREAFDTALSGVDWLAVRMALGDALSQVDGLSRAAVRMARNVYRDRKADADQLSADDRVNQGAEEVEAVLRKPETLLILQKFDERFDAAFAEISQPSGPDGSAPAAVEIRSN